MKILMLTETLRELNRFYPACTELQEKSHAHYPYLHAKFNAGSRQHDIFVIATGQDPTTLGAAVTALCEKLSPDCIIVAGSAKGLTDTAMGDVIISSTLAELVINNLRHQLFFAPQQPEQLTFHEYRANPELLAICCAVPDSAAKAGKIAINNGSLSQKEH